MQSLTIGSWTVRALETGYVWLDGGSMFGSVPKPLWSRLHPPDERNRVQLAMRCMLIEGEGRRILVDDGLGDKSSPRFTDIYNVDHSTHTLERSLAALGLAVGDITDVILTHLHFDHAGGSTRREEGRLVPRLPRARYYVQRRNWDNALKPNPRERASYLPENFQPLMDAGVLTLWEGVQRPWPGLEILTADGHTRGQQMVRVGGSDGVAYFVADLIPFAAHVRIPYVMGYDMAAIETMEEKARLLARAVPEGAWIMLVHDPLVALARPAAEGDDFAWAEKVAAAPAPGDAAGPADTGPGARTTG